MKRRFKCICAYDGTDFKGWQSQAGGGTVQDFIEGRLEQILKVKTRIHASGRTDSGVHATAQVFHFDAEWPHGCERLLAALRCGFPDSIQVRKVSFAKDSFHARYGVKRKRYVYRIYEGFAPPNITRYRWSLGNRKLDISAMNNAALALLGEHDFISFSANRGCDKEDTVKNLMELKVSRRGKEIKISTTGSGYLYKMVRMITGALVDVGLGKLTRADLERILKAKKRGQKIQSAPARGLTLERVWY